VIVVTLATVLTEVTVVTVGIVVTLVTVVTVMTKKLVSPKTFFAKKNHKNFTKKLFSQTT
jgi:hypothetical protein